ncbi:hypothetical protein CU044_0011 [Streptomyces sp. L-9-10]|nr:hypothetical protein CU044_0011 [Streptomyces sp. L-9-10]
MRERLTSEDNTCTRRLLASALYCRSVLSWGTGPRDLVPPPPALISRRRKP